MKPLLAAVAVTLIAAACSEPGLPTENERQLLSRLEVGVQEGGCPTAFSLLLVASDKKEIDGQAADLNGDGFACYLITHVTETEVFRTWTDNNIPLVQIGGCPNSFDLIVVNSETTGRTSDINGDGRVCTRVVGNGGTIVIDNNHRT